MTIDRTTGRIAWAPAPGATGVSDVRVRVEDGNGGAAEQRYAVAVIAAPPNRPPVFTSVPVVSATVGTAYPYQATATDNRDRTPVVECSPSSGSMFAIGSSTVSCTATDRSGNRGTDKLSLMLR